MNEVSELKEQTLYQKMGGKYERESLERKVNDPDAEETKQKA